MIPAKISKLVKDHKIEMVDLKFTDPRGTWQHTTIPIGELEGALERGIGFDGSSIKGFQNIYDSDLVLILDPDTAHVDPFLEVPTLSMIVNIHDPEDGNGYSRDPRNIAAKAEKALKKSDVADVSYWGPEAEFFLFSHLSYTVDPHHMSFQMDSDEAPWNSGRNGDESNLGYKIAHKSGYFPVPPADTLQDIRSEMTMHLEKWGARVEMHHHEVATAGQCEIDMRFDSLRNMADKLMIYKYVVRNTARKYGLVANFMPKPMYGDNGNGMHVHNSLWKATKNLFFAEKTYGELSQLAMYYVGGILSHVDSLLAFCAPTTNSYRRLVPHYEAPVNIAFSKRNRSAIVRIPMYYTGREFAKSKRIEFRAPDPLANPYFAFSAILMAGLDGVRRKIDPVKAGFGPLDKNIWELSGTEANKIKSVPGSLSESMRALERDHAYLLQDGVFTEDVLNMWKSIKQEEINEVNLRPSPYEFYLYSGV